MIIAVLSKYSDGILKKLHQLLPSETIIKVQPSDPAPLKTASILIGDYDWVGPLLATLPELKWLHGTWAGVNYLMPYIMQNDPPKFAVTRTTGSRFGQIMGEYVFANIVFWERNYFKVRENQMKKVWDKTTCKHEHRTLGDLKIGVLGVGAISTKIGQILNHLGSTIYGYGRREVLPLNDPEFNHIQKYFTRNTLEDLLSDVDYIINVLPSTNGTNDLLGNGILETCKGKNVVFINIGRGNVIKDAELVEALEKRWISGAILDVFEKEPLPEDSALWNMPNVFITPHIAGNTQPHDIAEQFALNLDRFKKGEPLVNQVDFEKGY